MTTSIDRVGFQTPRNRAQKKRVRAFAELIMSAALVLSIAIAATAVSIGIARAATPGVPADSGTVNLAILIGAIVAGTGILTAVTIALGGRTPSRD